ncbi:MAG: gephyrin-like molybdotransferase Glp [Lachnospiraceae bacterium]
MEALKLEQALQILLSRVEQIKEAENVALWDAGGRFLAQDIIADRDQPPFPRSPLDGYAVRGKEIGSADTGHPVSLKVIEEVTAGQVPQKAVGPGEAVRIMTGAPIPEGADCVVRQEDTDYGEEVVQIYQSVQPYQNYCFPGEDYKKGTRLLEKGTKLGFAEIGVLASQGYHKVMVYQRPKIALITTGDEVVQPGEELPDGKIYDSNQYMVGSRLQMWNMQMILREHIEDDERQVAARVKEVIGNADLVITTGGVSVGKKDIMHGVLNILPCEKLFWRVATKPGMPVLCAEYQGKLLICLSGNPFAAAVNLELLIRPLLQKMTGGDDLKTKRVQAVLEQGFFKKSKVTRYVRACYADGCVRIPEGSNGNGAIGSLCGCNCLIEIPAGTEKLDQGETVSALLL